MPPPTHAPTQIDDESIFPQQFGVKFPKNYLVRACPCACARPASCCSRCPSNPLCLSEACRLAWRERQLVERAGASQLPAPKPHLLPRLLQLPQEVSKAIYKRLFRVYAHIYHSHFKQVCTLDEEAHLNTCFKHFIFFVLVSGGGARTACGGLRYCWVLASPHVHRVEARHSRSHSRRW